MIVANAPIETHWHRHHTRHGDEFVGSKVMQAHIVVDVAYDKEHAHLVDGLMEAVKLIMVAVPQDNAKPMWQKMLHGINKIMEETAQHRHPRLDPGMMANWMRNALLKVSCGQDVPDLKVVKCEHNTWAWRSGGGMQRYCVKCDADLAPCLEMVKKHNPYADCGDPACEQCQVEE